jgi:hypothetical protein
MTSTRATPIQVYDGQILVGEIEDRGRHTVVAFRFDGVRRVKIGVFPDRRTAMRAVVGTPVPSREDA